ncbi:PRA1 family protein H-like isoform X2 [Durio zibethinus]|uniref:PRA1 family protein H-like isoform X2 n=1 Tax=Durio zibethinus TaxID=66656 RepID=A0A6P5XZA5_DURZI|nr:PRA1 family protein H-like isoform X2 [Durio zibethinus]
MVFSSNPLLLSVPDPTFESWLRDSGYLDIIDDHQTTAAAATTSTSVTTDSTITIPITGFLFGFWSLYFLIYGLCSLSSRLTHSPSSPPLISPAKLRSGLKGFSGIWGPIRFQLPFLRRGSGFMRMLSVMPGIMPHLLSFSLLVLCKLFFCLFPEKVVGKERTLDRFFSDKWGLDRFPVTQLVLIRIAQCATAIILIWLNVQMALCCALGVSYIIMILHTAF